MKVDVGSYDIYRKVPFSVVFSKRCMDLFFGFFGFLLFLGLYPIIALLIKLESPGPVIYKQTRVGLNRRLWDEFSDDFVRDSDIGGRPFTMYKFRSMQMDAEANGPQLSELKNDDRLTKIGKWLRTLHLDELPQFINILRGQMSFIGPRPERPHFTIQYSNAIPHYNKRTLHAKPGLTGLAQITLGYDDSLDSVIRKSYFDLSYSASLYSFSSWIKMEFMVLFGTIFYLVKRPDSDGSIKMPKSLEKIRQLPFKIYKKSEWKRHRTTGILRFNSYDQNIVLSDLSPWELQRKMNLLHDFGQKDIQVTISPHQNFDLEDLNFLINLVHKVREVNGKLTVRNHHPEVGRILKELHLDRVVNLERVRRTITNFMTVDVECWFHAYNLKSKISKSEWHLQESRIEANVQRILDLLKKHNATATFFVLGWVAEHFPEAVQAIGEAGHEIGTHGHYHNLITEMTPDEFERDVELSLKAIGRISAQKVIGHRGSNFTITKNTLWALKILAKLGLQYDSSIFPIGRKRYGIPDYPFRMPHSVLIDKEYRISEFPMSTLALGKKLIPIAGGGYLRLYPYRVTDRYIEQMNMGGIPAMMYFHPWELDIDQPRMNVETVKKFQHYVNLQTTEWKLSNFMERFKFSSIKEALGTSRVKRFIKKNQMGITLGGDKTLNDTRFIKINTSVEKNASIAS